MVSSHDAHIGGFTSGGGGIRQEADDFRLRAGGVLRGARDLRRVSRDDEDSRPSIIDESLGQLDSIAGGGAEDDYGIDRWFGDARGREDVERQPRSHDGQNNDGTDE